MRGPCLFLLAPLLAGCGSSGTTYKQYYELFQQSLRGSGTGVTLEQAADIPYASIGVRVDGSQQGLLVLATDTGGELMWTAASRVVLLTREGRIIKSVGLPKDRSATTTVQGQILPPPAQALKAPYRSVRQVDMPAIGAFSLVLSCNTQAQGAEMITILGTAMATMRVDEACQSANPRWFFTDSYWIDRDTGFVWRSVQHLYPGSVTVQTEILRPPG